MTDARTQPTRTTYRAGSARATTAPSPRRERTSGGNGANGANGDGGARAHSRGNGASSERTSDGLRLPSWQRHRRYVRQKRARRRDRRRQRRTPFGRHPVATATAVVVLLLAPVWISLGSALTNPALGFTMSARAAEWSRDHGFGGVITWAENLYYSNHVPPKGGKPASDAIPKGHTVDLPANRHGGLPAPAALTPFNAHPIAGEGKWVPAGRLVHGVPAVFTTFMAPDAVHTSVVDGVAWMDTRLLGATLYSGSYIPGGGPYTHTAPISPAASSTLVAAFNAGFRMQDAQGGYYTDGKVVLPLVNGAASVVIYKDGSVNVGAWGTDVKMTPSVASVRQNLSLLVDGGKVVPGIASNEGDRWGKVLGNSQYVCRSGAGVTSNGALIYVGGPNLDAVALANLLQRAGAVRGMELDINCDWVHFASYKPATANGAASGANGTDLLPAADMSNTPGRYWLSYWARDFFTMSARPPAG